MPTNNEVVVTGIGLTSALGNQKDEVWKAIISGKNGITEIPEKYKYLSKLGLRIAGVAKTPNFNELSIPTKQEVNKIVRMDKQAQMGIYAALSAVGDAGLDEKLLQDMGIIVGCGINESDKYTSLPLADRKPTWFFETYPNRLMGYLFQLLKTTGYGTTIVNACCGGMQAIGEGYRKIKHGELNTCLVGGCDDKLNETCISGFSRLNMLSKSDDATSAMRPFDKDRDGFVCGQGACMLVLENYENAVRRGAKIYGKVIGYGTVTCATSIADASYEGKLLAMKAALADAHLNYKQIEYINAHGTSTISNDQEESKAIKNVFKEKAIEIPISSTKSFLGHTFAACGALQSYICLQSLRTNLIHKNRNFRQSDESQPLNYLKENLECKDMEYCISNTSAIGGTNATLVFQKCDGIR